MVFAPPRQIPAGQAFSSSVFDMWIGRGGGRPQIRLATIAVATADGRSSGSCWHQPRSASEWRRQLLQRLAAQRETPIADPKDREDDQQHGQRQHSVV